MAVQTRQTLAHLRLVLELAGMGMDDVVKTTVMRTDWRYDAAYNAVYREHFAPPYPARSTVCSSLAQKGLLIEISAMAVAGASTSAVVATNDERAVRSTKGGTPCRVKPPWSSLARVSSAAASPITWQSKGSGTWWCWKETPSRRALRRWRRDWCRRCVLLNSSPEPSPIAWSSLKTLSGRPAVRRDFTRWAASNSRSTTPVFRKWRTTLPWGESWGLRSILSPRKKPRRSCRPCTWMASKPLPSPRATALSTPT